MQSRHLRHTSYIIHTKHTYAGTAYRVAFSVLKTRRKKG